MSSRYEDQGIFISVIMIFFNFFFYLDKHVMSSRYEEDQEDRYNDVLIVMELLTNLLSKDFIDFGEDGKYIHSDKVPSALFYILNINKWLKNCFDI